MRSSAPVRLDRRRSRAPTIRGRPTRRSDSRPSLRSMPATGSRARSGAGVAPSRRTTAASRRDARGLLPDAGASPAAARRPDADELAEIDVRDVPAAIRVPTVGHAPGRRSQMRTSRRAATSPEQIPGAHGSSSFPATDHLLVDARSLTRSWTRSRSSLTGVRPRPEPRPDAHHGPLHRHRRLDRSRQRISAIKKWRMLLDAHDDAVRVAAPAIPRTRDQDHGGRLHGVVRRSGASHQVRTSHRRGLTQRLGVQVRPRMHTGECEIRGDDLGGWQCIRAPESPPSPGRARCSSPRPCTTLSPAPGSRSTISANASLRTSAPAGYTPSRLPRAEVRRRGQKRTAARACRRAASSLAVAAERRRGDEVVRGAARSPSRSASTASAAGGGVPASDGFCMPVTLRTYWTGGGADLVGAWSAARSCGAVGCSGTCRRVYCRISLRRPGPCRRSSL